MTTVNANSAPTLKHPCRCAICMSVRSLLRLLRGRGVTTTDITTEIAKAIAATFAEGDEATNQCSRVWSQMCGLVAEIYDQRIEAVSWQRPTGNRLN
jgi:hypothetical protein